MSDIDAAAAEGAAKRLRERGLHAIGIGTDASDEDQIKAMIAAAVDEFGGLPVEAVGPAARAARLRTGPARL